MDIKKPLPIGVDNFEDIITNEYYYVDKTLMIKELLDCKVEATLFGDDKEKLSVTLFFEELTVFDCLYTLKYVTMILSNHG